MAESAENVDVVSDDQFSIFIKPSTGPKFEVSVEPATKIADLKQKIEEQAKIPAAQQRLIYSGRVLKDGDDITTTKVKAGQTVHLVKGAAALGSQANATSTSASTTTVQQSSPPPQQVPTNLAAGQGTGNVLADLTGARYAGMNIPLPSASMFGPDGMPNLNILESPEVAAQMNQMLQDPEMIEMLLQSNPELRDSAPLFRQLLQDEGFRRMLTNPQQMRRMMELQQAMGGGGMGGFGGAGRSSFPAPGGAEGQTNTTGQTAQSPTNAPAANPFAPADPAANPFAALMGNRAGGMPAINPDLLASLMGGARQPSAPEDTRPPEVRYESQLAQLNELGFYDFDRNVAALRRSGGNVQGAVEALLDGQL